MRHIPMRTTLRTNFIHMQAPSSQTRTPLRLAVPSIKVRPGWRIRWEAPKLREPRTPAFVIDRHVFSKNCEQMHANTAGYGATFRAHPKSHKMIVPTVLWGNGAPLRAHFTLTRPWREPGFSLSLPSAATHAVVAYTMMRSLESGQIRNCVRGRGERRLIWAAHKGKQNCRPIGSMGRSGER
ncbi:hypothetical protein BJV74DRAFT_480656 [Russula compacta]|nr:hypothetical protein BJV74DRAFT_480656 [Russula compacta]